MTPFLLQNQYEGNQWGRPGPGGPYWRERTLTGQGFFEKMVSKQKITVSNPFVKRKFEKFMQQNTISNQIC